MINLEEKVIKSLKEHIDSFETEGSYSNIGKIIGLSEGIATLSGLSEVKMGEVLLFPDNILGLAINLKKGEVGAIVLGDFLKLKEGQEVKSTGKLMDIEASYGLLGRIIDPLVNPIDGNGAITHTKDKKLVPVEKIAPGIVMRSPVNTPLATGIKAIDAMIPIGRGQRELIIGDRNTGKTAIAVDAIINQSRLNKQKDAKKVISIYVGIGQKQSKVVQLVNKLVSHNAMNEVIVLSASSADPVSLQYIAPYVGTAIAEYFMDKGEDVLVIYDDLTKHAWAYRQISLTLRRPSGREAYPGDIFYLHSKLLERSCKLSDKYGGGSITSLPIIETQAQDISSYIPTNVISITDGQIYLEPDLFYQGVRPAINVGLSVSRVGGAAQLKSMKSVAGKLRLELASYNELLSFAQFGSDLDDISKKKIERGKRIIEILKQKQYEPLSLADEVLSIWIATKGLLDRFEVEKVAEIAEGFSKYAISKDKKIEETISSKDGITKEIESKLDKMAESYLQRV